MRFTKFCIFIFSIVCCPGFCQESRDDKLTRKFLDGLPEFTDSLAVDSLPDESDFYDSFLFPAIPDRSDKMANALINLVKPVDLAQIYKTKLLLNDKLVEMKSSKKANKAFGIAMCENGNPIILIGSRADKKLSPYSLVFVIYHEYAHHLLGTTSCVLKRDFVPQDEIEADCKASELLQKYFHQDGASIVYHTSGVLYNMNKPRRTTHPGTIDRAEALLRGADCVNRSESID